MSPIGFTIAERLPGALGRAGVLVTPHGEIRTPAFVVVGTKATVKALTPEQVKRDVGAQVVLANTYHLYLEPGERIVEQAGGLGKFMHWEGPTMTDSGGFQVFSLGAAFGKGVSKFTSLSEEELAETATTSGRLAVVDEDGATFRSHLDGSTHRLTPERSMEIQHAIGADIVFAFDEPTAPAAPRAYQEEALARTHRWAERSLAAHKALGDGKQGLYGIVQGGKFEELRKESAKTIAGMDFDGFGIGGSYTKEHLDETLAVAVRELPEEKPRHLLGIGEPEDLFIGVENGIDTFDCVSPTRLARTGMIYTKQGKVNLLNAAYAADFSPLDAGCDCSTCIQFTRAYVSHLFRAKEMLAATLASIHNLRFLVRLVEDMRAAIIDGSFASLKEEFLSNYRRL